MQPAVARLKPEKGLFDQSSPPGDAGSLKGQTRRPKPERFGTTSPSSVDHPKPPESCFNASIDANAGLTAKTDAEPGKLHQLLLCQ